MTCQDCTDRARKRWHGGYQAQCLGCAAALLASSYPSRQQWAVMCWVIRRDIERWSPTFGLDDVKASALQILEKRRCLKRK